MELQHPQRFFAALRSGLLGPTLSSDEVSGCSAILEACKGWPVSWQAYGLATAYHETAHTMQPIKEYGGPSYLRRMYDIDGLRPEKARELGNLIPGDGVKFCGRGYVQLTGRTNYAHADKALDLHGDLVANPDLAMMPSISAQILEQGMREGWFTTRRLDQFLPMMRPATRAEFMAARRIINGTDRNDLIADYSLRFQDALLAGQ
jgi:putative chitinase